MTVGSNRGAVDEHLFRIRIAAHGVERVATAGAVVILLPCRLIKKTP